MCVYTNNLCSLLGVNNASQIIHRNGEKTLLEEIRKFSKKEGFKKHLERNSSGLINWARQWAEHENHSKLRNEVIKIIGDVNPEIKKHLQTN
ncbi:MAG: hypothetical protein U5L76_00095 [Patescibacteria group bacterium]|nr:hypothetical protein [Patescibacteria group bacterium]MDZ7798003.1 hypothetical protein [Patescibacteria group bacterium]